MKRFALIMAGGDGTRFWPLSRRERPKFLLPLIDGKSLLNATVERLEKAVPRENIFIVTNQTQFDAVLNSVEGKILPDHILQEPECKNTAPCIGYGMALMMKIAGNGLFCSVPADCYIADDEVYVKTLDDAFTLAEERESLITVGINPTAPLTGYGYIEYDSRDNNKGKQVVSFREKPVQKVAEQYLKAGNYLWNSGILVGKTEVLAAKFKSYLPEIYEVMTKIKETEQLFPWGVVEEMYAPLPDVSFDCGILEKCTDLLVIKGDFGWSDIGSWDNFQNILEIDNRGNGLKGDVLALNCKNTVVYGERRLIVAVGVEDLAIVDSGDALLVCRKNKAQEVKKAVEKLKKSNRNELL